MNHDNEFPTETSPAAGDSIGRLLRLAGPRPLAPHEREARVKESVRAEWRATVRGRRSRRWLVRGGIGLAAAASLAAAIGLFYRPAITQEPAFEGTIAYVETVSGPVQLLEGRTATSAQPLQAGDEIHAGAIIDTGILGRAAIRLASGSSLRLDRGTRLRGVTDAAVGLDSGGVYFDSGAKGEAEPIEIRTRLGVVHNIGTRFEVRLDSDEMRVRVREGEINLDSDGQLYDAGAGVELTIDSAGALSRRSVPIFGPDWEWILAVAPPFELEGQTLDVFLDWITGETGWEPRFVDPDAASGASGVVLHGSVEDMRPEEALEAVLPTCGLVHRLDSGILIMQAEGP